MLKTMCWAEAVPLRGMFTVILKTTKLVWKQKRQKAHSGASLSADLSLLKIIIKQEGRSLAIEHNMIS